MSSNTAICHGESILRTLQKNSICSTQLWWNIEENLSVGCSWNIERIIERKKT
ncbi:MAG TPA: hypothetical protein VEF91_08075 [Verrucomicrobiae bacterium]|nr:hypothetical protein [Verrucomicrobiae bacterium]